MSVRWTMTTMSFRTSMSRWASMSVRRTVTAMSMGWTSICMTAMWLTICMTAMRLTSVPMWGRTIPTMSTVTPVFTLVTIWIEIVARRGTVGILRPRFTRIRVSGWHWRGGVLGWRRRSNPRMRPLCDWGLGAGVYVEPCFVVIIELRDPSFREWSPLWVDWSLNAIRWRQMRHCQTQRQE